LPILNQPPGQTTTDPNQPGYWGNVQHFDIWQFATADKDSGQQSYFGTRLPNWLAEKRKASEFGQAGRVGEKAKAFVNSPPESRHHFDIWQFATADKDSGQQVYSKRRYCRME